MKMIPSGYKFTLSVRCILAGIALAIIATEVIWMLHGVSLVLPATTASWWLFWTVVQYARPSIFDGAVLGAALSLVWYFKYSEKPNSRSSRYMLADGGKALSLAVDAYKADAYAQAEGREEAAKARDRILLERTRREDEAKAAAAVVAAEKAKIAAAEKAKAEKDKAEGDTAVAGNQDPATLKQKKEPAMAGAE